MRRQRAGRRRGRALLVALAAVAVLVVVLVLLLPDAARRPGQPAGDPVSPAPGPVPAPTASDRPEPAPVAQRGLGERIVRAAGRWVSGDLVAVAVPDGDAAVAAYEGTFSDGARTVTLRARELDSPESAAAAAATAPEGSAPEDRTEAGAVGEPAVGAYELFERDGAAVLRWTHGPFVLELRGPPGAVRELYLAYPL